VFDCPQHHSRDHRGEDRERANGFFGLTAHSHNGVWPEFREDIGQFRLFGGQIENCGLCFRAQFQEQGLQRFGRQIFGACAPPENAGVPDFREYQADHQRGDRCDVRFNWFTLYYRYQTIDTYFGTSFYTLDTSGAQPLITYKKVILKNDYIHHVVDIYHV